MRLILLGPPGSGKGTQAKSLSQRLQLRHISTGDLLRQAVRLDTPAGRRAKPFVESGQLVPDDLVNDIIREMFAAAPRPEHFVMDGYPRTVSQAQAFDEILRQQQLPVDAVAQLLVPDEELVRRLSGRWTCPNLSCQTSYHTVFKPPRVPGICDVCGTALTQREDDREATVRQRLAIFHKNNADLLKYYQGQGLLRQVPAEGDIEAMYAKLVQVLDDKGAAMNGWSGTKEGSPMRKSVFQRPPELKSSRELALMREAGKLVAAALRLCRDMAKPGVRTGEIDRAVEDLYARHGATPLFKGYPGQKVPFPAVTCISLNEQVVHGIPGPRQIKDGDLVKIDTACKLNGWCADAAITMMIGEVRPERRRLVRVAEEVLQIAIDELGRRQWWSEVAARMQRHAEGNGFSVVQQYVGHGIGRIMHENPQVPNFVSRELRDQDFRLEEGLVLAVEPMVNMGRPDTRVLSDHWTVVTRDGLPSAHVEHTLALTRQGVQIITADEAP